MIHWVYGSYNNGPLLKPNFNTESMKTTVSKTTTAVMPTSNNRQLFFRLSALKDLFRLEEKHEKPSGVLNQQESMYDFLTEESKKVVSFFLPTVTQRGR